MAKKEVKDTPKAETPPTEIKRGRGRPVGSKTKTKTATVQGLKESKKSSKTVKQDEELTRRLSRARSSLMTGISAWAAAPEQKDKPDKSEPAAQVSSKSVSYMSLNTETSPAPAVASPTTSPTSTLSGKVSFDSLMGNVEKPATKSAKAANGKVTLDSLLG